MKIVVSCGSIQIEADILTEGSEPELLTLGELRDYVAEEHKLDKGQMKMLHRGRILQGEDDVSLETLGFKEKDKIIVMGGRKMTIKDDPVFTELLEYEKRNLCGLQTMLIELGKDLTELEKNFLDEKKQREMAKKLDKRIKQFNEVSERHLVALDGIKAAGEGVAPNQVQRNREKRKTLIDGVQTLLTENDTYARRLEEYFGKLDGNIIE